MVVANRGTRLSVLFFQLGYGMEPLHCVANISLPINHCFGIYIYLHWLSLLVMYDWVFAPDIHIILLFLEIIKIER